ncbi:MAG: helix-turn-helix domain-containing protein [Bifidobacteriaceae bacterium]|jgi:transcriptional regulator with XRE-family HTH domain|nr:helix-turn-helix domain-containing protein [Bifidobacteriaceae bacterium]
MTTQNTDTVAEAARFLRSHRDRLTPADAGLPRSGRRRRPGLRREEVAHLAGLSLEYYNRIERGNLSGVSDAVLAGLTDALRLTSSETVYLSALTHAQSGHTDGAAVSTRLRPHILQFLDAIDPPAWVMNHVFDVLAANRMAKAVHEEMFTSTCQPPNPVRFAFLDPDADRAALDPTVHQARLAALVHAAYARHSADPAFAALICDLIAQSETFRSYWDRYDVGAGTSGAMFLRHRLVGPMTLDFEVLAFPSDPGLVLNVQTAAPGTPTATALARLATMLDPA